MSKRAGRFVTLEELLDEVGPDAVRWFYLSRAPETMMEFDLELATTHNKTNPVYYVQYAHARLSGIERTAAGRGLPDKADLGALEHPWELDLARQLAHWPDALAEAARLLEPHRIPYFIYELADRVSTFYEAGNEKGEFRVVVDDPRLTRARLELARAARATLRSGLDLIGVTAPERMDRTTEED
jgi:arginyl-tRNA synthetase